MSFRLCSRFVYCRPVGGLNDTLCEIARCWDYAEKTNRALVIDTRVSGLMGQFSSFFAIKPTKISVFTTVTQELLDHLNTLKCFPEVITGRFGTYATIHDEDFEARLEVETDTVLTFDLDAVYEHGILLRETLGGGHASERAIERITLLPEVRDEVLKALIQLPPSYVGVHVRNTDYVTIYKEYFERLLPKVTGRTVLVCSDDAEVVEYAKKYFELSKVITSSVTPVEKGKRLHKEGSFSDDAARRQAAINSIIDVFALAGGDRLYYTNVTRGRTSGFSMLAQFLRKNKEARLRFLGMEGAEAST